MSDRTPTTADCGRRDPHAPHTETGTMMGRYYSHNCGGLTVEPRPPYVLRLTGEQIGSIDPPPDGDWFTDWDEYEDFVPRRMLAEARAPLDVERLARAICAVRKPTVTATADMFVDDECRAEARAIELQYAALEEPTP
jgi:hypothetical protein